MVWWWPFGRKQKPKDPVEQWNADLREWLDSMTTVFAAFPDHSGFSGPVDEKTARVMAEITDLYSGEACEVVAQFELKAERLRRYLEARRNDTALPDPSISRFRDRPLD